MYVTDVEHLRMSIYNTMLYVKLCHFFQILQSKTLLFFSHAALYGTQHQQDQGSHRHWISHIITASMPFL